MARSSWLFVLCSSIVLSAQPVFAGSISWSPPRRPAADPNAPLKAGAAGYVDPGAFAGPVAERRAGEVVFSSAPISLTATDDAAAISTWDLSTPLHMRFFAEESQQNLLPGCEDRRFTVNLMVNPPEGAPFMGDAVLLLRAFKLAEPTARPAATLTSDAAQSFRAPTTWSAQEDPKLGIVRTFNAEVVPQLVPGDNLLAFRVSLDCRGRDVTVADGELTVVVTEATKATYLKAYGTRLPAPTHPENGSISRQILSVLAGDANWAEDRLLGAQVTSAAWEPIRNELTGVLTGHRIGALILTHRQDEPNPDVCVATATRFVRDASGGPLRYEGGAQGWALPCSSAPVGVERR